MGDPSLAKQLVDAVIADFPDHKAGTRPIHTIGVGVEGYFVASDVAKTYCKAEHFRGQKVPVTVRFSNGSGSPAQHDGWSDVRGMATRFHIRDGVETDLIAMTLGEFFVRNTDQFLAFTKSAQQTPIKKEGFWQKIRDMLQFKPPLPDPHPGQTASGDAGTLKYANANKFAQLGVFQAGLIGAPESYARAAYHAVHTFIIESPDGVKRPVRFSWKPVAGVRNTDPEAPPVDVYLKKELEDRLDDWPARFLMMMMIGEPGDALEDPTVAWPAKRVRVVMGTLYLTGIAKDQTAKGEKIGFNPCNFVPGMEGSDDPILAARRDAYAYSQELRWKQSGTSAACPFHRS
jgi:catalase